MREPTLPLGWGDEDPENEVAHPRAHSETGLKPAQTPNSVLPGMTGTCTAEIFVNKPRNKQKMVGKYCKNLH